MNTVIESKMKKIGILASVTAAIESTKPDIETIGLHSDDEPYLGSVHFSLPLNEVEGIENVQINSQQAELRHKDLHIGLSIEVDDIDPSISKSSDSAVNNINEDYTVGDEVSVAEKTNNQFLSFEHSNKDSSSSNRSKDIRKRHQDSIDSKPHYQDPERLEAVYETNETFDEMKEALDVDVTAQTVRNYMIKHGIHDPKPRPDRVLESIQASELELTKDE